MPQRFRNLALSAALLVSLLPVGASAQDAPLWLRHSSISPDGSTIAFTYAGDIYRVPATGGVATVLTRYEGSDLYPVWSPDGQSIAFASDRAGNLDVWVMPATGGPANRLTYHSGDDVPSAFTPDGSKVIFTATRLDVASSSIHPALSELYEVPVSGGRERQIMSTPAEEASFDAAGDRIIFQDDKGYEDPYRKHHTSSITKDIWIYDVSDSSYTQLTYSPAEDRDPSFTADGQSYVFLSERSGSFNVYRASLNDPENAVALTSFERHPVRYLSLSNDGVAAFSWNGALYTVAEGSQPRRVDVQIRTEVGTPQRRPLEVDAQVSEMALSPSGKELAFVHRGEIFATSIETNVTKQVTRTPGQERSISFSPDGRSILYAAERDGSWNIYRTTLREGEKYFFNSTVLEETPVLVTDEEVFQPVYSPDGEEIAYLENRETIRILNVASGESRTVVGDEHLMSYADGDQWFEWSPDGEWLTFAYRWPQSEVGIVRTRGDTTILNVTRSGYDDSRPRWGDHGSLIYWFSSRDGLRSPSINGSTERDVYGVFMTREALEEYQLSKEEFELQQSPEDSDGDEPDDDSVDTDDDGDDAEGADSVVVEVDGLRDRRVRLTIHSSRLGDAVMTPDGSKLLYMAAFEGGHDLWVTDLRTRETKTLAKLGGRGGSLALDSAGKNVFVLSGGSI